MKAEAIKKINDALTGNKNPALAMVAERLYRRLDEDEGFAEDVLDDKHTLDGCWHYILDHARKAAKNGVFMESGEDENDSKVYEWAEDYFRKTAEQLEAEKPKAPIKFDVEKAKRDAVNQSEKVTKKTKQTKKEEADEFLSLFEDQLDLFEEM